MTDMQRRQAVFRFSGTICCASLQATAPFSTSLSPQRKTRPSECLEDSFSAVARLTLPQNASRDRFAAPAMTQCAACEKSRGVFHPRELLS